MSKPTRKRRKSSGVRVPADDVPRAANPKTTLPLHGGNAPARAQSDSEDIAVDDEEVSDTEEMATVVPETAPREDDTIVDATPVENRASTVALSEEDLEELEGDVAPRAPLQPEESGEVLTEEMIEEVASEEPPSEKPKKPPPAPPPSREAQKGRPWFETVFQEEYLRTLPYLTPKCTKLEAEFVCESVGVEPGQQILDLGCGYGRHAMELAARGVHVVGLDLSLPLLLRGADEAQRRGLNIHFVHGDMRELAFDGQFDGGYCLFFTYGYFEDEVNVTCLENIFRALKPGARFVLQILNRDYLIADLPSRVWWEGDSCVVLEEIEFNYFSSRVVSNRSIVFEDGRQIEQEISIRSYSLHELGNLLHEIGFRITDISGNMLTKGRFLGNYSREIIITVERPA